MNKLVLTVFPGSYIHAHAHEHEHATYLGEHAGQEQAPKTINAHVKLNKRRTGAYADAGQVPVPGSCHGNKALNPS